MKDKLKFDNRRLVIRWPCIIFCKECLCIIRLSLFVVCKRR